MILSGTPTEAVTEAEEEVGCRKTEASLTSAAEDAVSEAAERT